MVPFKVVEISFYDVLLDFVLLDAFDDLATPPYTVATAVQNRWLSARIKETVCDNKNLGLCVFVHFFFYRGLYCTLTIISRPHFDFC